MEIIRARHKGKKNIYVHNDLSNSAFHFKKQIEAKLDADDKEGLSFEYMACLAMLAFTFEAKINFIGHKVIKNWKERQPFNDKVSEVFTHLKITPNWDVRPYSSLKSLKYFRDSIAHGKPVEIEFDEKVELPEDEIDRRIDLDSEWLEYCSHDNVFNTYDDIDSIWKNLVTAAGIEIYETITHGSSGLTFIEKFIEK